MITPVTFNTVVTVNNDTTLPTVSIGVRKSSAGSGLIAVTATANDNVGVAKVEFYVNGVLASTATAAPYLYTWDSTAVADGSYSLMARAYDAAGNIGQSGNVRLAKPKVQFR
jgi:chitinase